MLTLTRLIVLGIFLHLVFCGLPVEKCICKSFITSSTVKSLNEATNPTADKLNLSSHRTISSVASTINQRSPTTIKPTSLPTKTSLKITSSSLKSTRNPTTPSTNQTPSVLTNTSSQIKNSSLTSTKNPTTSSTNQTPSVLTNTSSQITNSSLKSTENSTTPSTNQTSSVLTNTSSQITNSSLTSTKNSTTPSTNQTPSELTNTSSQITNSSMTSTENSTTPSTNQTSSVLTNTSSQITNSSLTSTENSTTPSTNQTSSVLTNTSSQITNSSLKSTENSTTPSTNQTSSVLTNTSSQITNSSLKSTENSTTPSTNQTSSVLTNTSSQITNSSLTSTKNSTTPSTNQTSPVLTNTSSQITNSSLTSTENPTTPSTNQTRSVLTNTSSQMTTSSLTSTKNPKTPSSNQTSPVLTNTSSQITNSSLKSTKNSTTPSTNQTSSVLTNTSSQITNSSLTSTENSTTPNTFSVHSGSGPTQHRRKRRENVPLVSEMTGYYDQNGTCICFKSIKTTESTNSMNTEKVVDISCTKDGKECDRISNAHCNNNFKKCECSNGFEMDPAYKAKCVAVTPSVKRHYTTAIPSLANTKIKLNFEIKVGDSTTKFNSSLKDTNSPTFKIYKEEFETKLTQIFNKTPGFDGIEVYGFRNGSVIAEYKMILKSFNYLQNASESINEAIQGSDVSTIKIFNFKVNLTFLRENINRNIDIYKSNCSAFSKDICPVGFICQTVEAKHYCKDLCIKDDEPLCGKHGKCYVDVKTFAAKCSCFNEDGYVYHGKHCQLKAEKLNMDSKYIITIAAGCGGVLLLTTIILIMCLIRFKRKISRFSTEEKDSTFKPVEMTDLRRDKFGKPLEGFHEQRKSTTENEYQSGLPSQEIKYLQGREHQIYKNEKGEETYFYQPSSNKSSVGSEFSIGPTVYDYIDTESKFEIQRPNIRLGHLNRF